MRLSRVNRVPANNRPHTFKPGNLFDVDLEEIVREKHEISRLARGEQTLVRGFPGSDCTAD